MKEYTLPSLLFNYMSRQAVWASWKVKAAVPAPGPFHGFGGGGRLAFPQDDGGRPRAPSEWLPPYPRQPTSPGL